MSEFFAHIRPGWLILAAFSCLPATSVSAQSHPRPSPFMDRGIDRGPMRPPAGRAISDQDHARSRIQSGENRSFEELLGSARRVGRGEFLAVEPDISTNIYRFKFMRPTGNMIWVDVDGRTGRIIAERD